MPSSRQKAKDAAADQLSAAESKRLVHKGLVLHFMVQLSLGDDADARLTTQTLGRVHHRILYFAHFTPGITVSELLSVLGVKHQNIQGQLRQLVEEGYILTKASEADGRVKQLYCSRKGDKLLEMVSAGQRERIQRAYDAVTPQDMESYFKVMAAMLGPDRREWVRRLTELDDPTDSV
ncbi:MAG: MarR family winged helix-turn-helix transcriptional regulator [Bradyrhizobium sp.]|jgi:DNA-binding MarR family transcriptional regulator|uniref:MarR family winged helix-turn-helix transcriptional regulator n=1 Tax=Bradyrhizobium sp. TaxID=376 RepID=UPI003D0D5D81